MTGFACMRAFCADAEPDSSASVHGLLFPGSAAKPGRASLSGMLPVLRNNAQRPPIPKHKKKSPAKLPTRRSPRAAAAQPQAQSPEASSGMEGVEYVGGMDELPAAANAAESFHSKLM